MFVQSLHLVPCIVTASSEALARLCGCTGSSETRLLTYVIGTNISGTCSLIIVYNISATTVRIPKCPSRVPRTPFLKEYGSSCYRFIINTHAKWQDAENDCRRYGGHLVSIGSYAENMFVYNTLRVNDILYICK